jgi:hypothetical protein
MRRTTLATTFLACALLLPASAPGLAQSRHDWEAARRPQDVLARFPPPRLAWRAVVPSTYRHQGWVYNLAGTASAMRFVNSGRPLVSGSVCRPHDCGDHVLAYLIAIDGSRAVGAMLLPKTADGTRRELYFGTPSPQERSLLAIELYRDRP